MKTQIASAANGHYHEIRPNALPAEWEASWPNDTTAKLRELLGRIELIDDIRVGERGLIHLDLKQCTKAQHRDLLEILVVVLIQLRLHDSSQGVEYCTLEPGRGDER